MRFYPDVLLSDAWSNDGLVQPTPSILSPPGGEEEEQWNETICSGEWEMWAENHRWGILANTMDQSSVVGIDPTHLASLSSRLKPHTLHLLITTWDQKKVRDYSLFYKGCASETRSQTSTPPPSSGFPWCLILGPEFPPEQDQSNKSYPTGWSVQGNCWWELTQSLENSQHRTIKCFIPSSHLSPWPPAIFDIQ